MDKRVLTIIAVILLAIGGGVTYLLLSSEDKVEQQTMRDERASNEADAIQSTGTADSTGVGRGAYVDYSDSVIAETSGVRLLFFHAPWCPQCRALEADIKKQGVPENVTIIKVDYDSNQTLRKKYGVTLQTTVVRIDDQGNLAERFVAYDDPSLDAVILSLL